jgi:hypothetical protein
MTRPLLGTGELREVGRTWEARMTRSVFDLPLRLRRTYMAAIQLMDEDAADSDDDGPAAVRDVDIAGITLHHVSETRRHLLDLGNDLLEVGRDGEQVCVVGSGRSSALHQRGRRPGR